MLEVRERKAKRFKYRQKERQAQVVNLLVNEAIILPALTTLAELMGLVSAEGEHGKPNQRGRECTQTLCIN